MSEFVESDPVGYLVAGTFLKGTSLENDESDRAKMFDPLLQSVVRSQQARVVHALQRKQAMRNGLKDYKIDALDGSGLLACPSDGPLGTACMSFSVSISVSPSLSLFIVAP